MILSRYQPETGPPPPPAPTLPDGPGEVASGSAAPTAEAPRVASDDSVVMAHGGGGQLTDQLIHQHILPRLGNPTLSLLGDSAVLPPSFNDRVALTIDSYVVQPWRFPGGDVGRIAVCGTVNDLSVTGATPRGIALGIVVSEGFSLRDLDRVLASVAGAAAEADVDVVAGDTKVVDYHDPPEIMLTTAGVGYRPFSYRPMLDRVHPGDKLLINGPVGDHGLAVMLARELPEMQVALRSDAAPLNHLIARCLSRTHEGVVFMRDATRGGLAGVTADIAQSTGLHVVLDESAIPIRPAARHAADLLGLDPLEIANEGKLVMIARPAAVDTLLMEMDGYGGDPWERPRVIGEITDIRDGLCELITTLGGRRILQKPYGEELPRIC